MRTATILQIPFSLQAMEGKKVFALFLLLSALVAAVHTRPQVMNNPKQSLSVPGSPQVGSQVKPDGACHSQAKFTNPMLSTCITLLCMVRGITKVRY